MNKNLRFVVAAAAAWSLAGHAGAEPAEPAGMTRARAAAERYQGALRAPSLESLHDQALNGQFALTGEGPVSVNAPVVPGEGSSRAAWKPAPSRGAIAARPAGAKAASPPADNAASKRKREIWWGCFNLAAFIGSGSLWGFAIGSIWGAAGLGAIAGTGLMAGLIALVVLVQLTR